MNLGGKVVVLDGRSYMQTKENSQKTRINYEEGQYVVYLWLASKGEEAQRETEKVLKGNRFAILATESEQPASVSVVSPHEVEQKARKQRRRCDGGGIQEIVCRKHRRGRCAREAG